MPYRPLNMLIAGLVSAAVCLPTLAQANPLDRRAGSDTAAATQAAPNARAVAVPGWVQPGAQVVYEVRIAGPGNALKYTVLDVAHVTPRGVIVQVSTTRAEPLLGNGLYLDSAGVMLIDEMTIQTGMGFFMRPADLPGMASSDGVVVTREQYPLGGQMVDVVVRNTAGRNRTTYLNRSDNNRAVGRTDDQFSFADSFEVQTGIKVSERVTQSDGATAFDRDGRPTRTRTRVASGTQSVLQGFRQVPGGWRGRAFPQWAQAVEQISYAGTMTMTMAANGMRVQGDVEATYDITERGDGYAIGTSTQTVRLPDGQQQSGTSAFLVSNNLLGGPWMSPEALAALPNGLIDTEPHTATQTHVSREGDAVVLTVQTTGGDRAVTYYDPQTGTATRLVIETNVVNRMVMDLQLTGTR